MAVVTPFLLVLILGMVDAGWAFSNHLEVRHGAREGARLAAVSAAPFQTAAQIIAETCDRMNTTSPDVSVALSFPDGTSVTGATALIAVTRNHNGLTGFIPFFDGITLDSAIEIRLEQPATWTADSGACGP